MAMIYLERTTVKEFYNMVQGSIELSDVYMDRFKELRNAAVASAGGVGYLVPEIMKTSSKYKDWTDNERVEAAKAMYFFIHADRIRFGANINHVNAGVVLGTDQYPMNLDKAYAILSETQRSSS